MNAVLRPLLALLMTIAPLAPVRAAPVKRVHTFLIQPDRFDGTGGFDFGVAVIGREFIIGGVVVYYDMDGKPLAIPWWGSSVIHYGDDCDLPVCTAVPDQFHRFLVSASNGAMRQMALGGVRVFVTIVGDIYQLAFDDDGTSPTLGSDPTPPEKNYRLYEDVLKFRYTGGPPDAIFQSPTLGTVQMFNSAVTQTGGRHGSVAVQVPPCYAPGTYGLLTPGAGKMTLSTPGRSPQVVDCATDNPGHHGGNFGYTGKLTDFTLRPKAKWNTKGESVVGYNLTNQHIRLLVIDFPDYSKIKNGRTFKDYCPPCAKREVIIPRVTKITIG